MLISDCENVCWLFVVDVVAAVVVVIVAVEEEALNAVFALHPASVVNREAAIQIREFLCLRK